MPLRKLRRYIRKIESEGYDSTPYRVDLQVKISFPVLNVITAFLGIPFALRLPRIRGLAAAVGMSLILGFTFWVLFAVTVSIGQTGLLHPLVAAWAANILLPPWASTCYFVWSHRRFRRGAEVQGRTGIG